MGKTQQFVPHGVDHNRKVTGTKQSEGTVVGMQPAQAAREGEQEGPLRGTVPARVARQKIAPLAGPIT